jgi:type IV pilus assembly protein PilO
MTVSGDFAPSGNGQDFESAPNYPSAFGLTLTPTVSGILVAVLGLAGAAYLLVSQVQPTWEQYQALDTEVQDLESQVQQKRASLKKIDEVKANLEQAKQQRADVLALFADEKTLDTLLLDLNRLVSTGGAQLNSFVPGAVTVVNDGSLGPAVNGKLKRQEVAVTLNGGFDQTRSIIRNVERLQPLLVVRGLTSQLDRTDQKLVVNSRGGVISPPGAKLNTSFTLNALMPLTPEETAAATSQPKQ